MESTKRQKVKSIRNECIIFIYTLFVALFAVGLFLYGFFPVKHYDTTIATRNSIPDSVEHIRIKKDALYKPIIKKVVIMIIDALRWDFVTEPTGKIAMPIMSSLIANNSACLLQAKADAPTVTMPRIKAITTGTVPSFADVALNFGGKPVIGDSILLQAKNHGHRLIFYGDDTWLKLFPGIFDRSDGTTSFFVTDFTEVDTNVTRHIYNELRNEDWSIMVLHYLGLDHIGHVEGPTSPLIEPKLKEMDNIIGQIHTEVAHWNEQGVPSLFIVCGDHGMKDSGGHGGSTLQETLVPFMTIGASCPSKNNEPNQIAQIDIGATLAVMLGVPIPASNIGSVCLDIFNGLSISKKLFVLYYNSKQVFNHFQRLADYKSRRPYQKYINAIKLHVTWLTSDGQTSEMIEEIMFMYHTALKGMKEILVNSMIKYDLYIMTIAMVLIYHVLYFMVNTQKDTTATSKKMLYLIIINIILWLSINYIWETESKAMLYTNETNSIFLTVFILGILLINCYLCAKLKCTMQPIKELAKGGLMQWILSLGALIHALSLSSSSFVEEEHQTWYFLWVTFFIYLLYDNARMLIVHWPSCRHDSLCPHVQVSIKLLMLLLGHRILRKLNSTGDQYGHLPDIADWLQKQECNICMTLVLISALVLLVWIGYACEEEKYKRKSLLFNVAVAVCVYLRHMASEAVARVPSYPSSRGIYELRVFWILIILFLLVNLYRLLDTVNYDKRNFLSLLLFIVVQLWVMISAMLHRPYNVGLLPIQLIFSSVIQEVFKVYGKQDTSIHIHCWLGNIFYFYQGNSNSLATIDVAAGYIGLESYRPYITGVFLVINTYSAPVLAYLTLLYGVALENPYSACKTVLPINKSYATWRLLPMAVYTIVVSIQRYHLFVWSVFSPKLLYEAVYCAVMYFIITIVQIFFILHDIINESNR